MSFVSNLVKSIPVIGSIANGIIGNDAAKSAASIQQQGAGVANQQIWNQLGNAQNNLQPYINQGYNNLQTQQDFANRIGQYGQFGQYLKDNGIASQFQGPTADTVAQTPGYQFALQQGLKSQQNQAAARGLGYSGAQIKGAQSYATGLADQTYQNQYNNALNQFNTNYQAANNTYNQGLNQLQTAYNNYGGLTNRGEQAASQLGSFGLNAANAAGNFITQGANANAAGRIGAANAITGSINSVSNNLQQNDLLKNFGGSGSLYG